MRESRRKTFETLSGRRAAIWVFVGFLALILASQWRAVDQPPVWDTAMSVFPAGIYLAQNSFDLPALLSQPGYALGGPNVHALSLVTWITGGLYAAFVGPPQRVLVAVHILHFLLAAAAFTCLWSIGRRVLGPAAALAATAVVFLLPLVHAQTGRMYLEFPLLLCAALALRSWLGHRLLETSIWLTLAVMVKPTGDVMAGALALATLADRGPWTGRFRSAALLLVGPATVSVVTLLYQPGGMLDPRSITTSLIYVLMVPDVALLVVAFLAATLAWRPWRSSGQPLDAESPDVHSPDAQSPDAEPAIRFHRAVACLVLTFFGFFLVLPLLGSGVPILPRYYLLIVPFAFLSLSDMIRRRVRPRLAAWLLAAIAAFSLANRSGDLYPYNDLHDFAIIERSMAYQDLLEVQRQGLSALAQEADQVPVFYGLPEQYLLDYPEMGYGVERPADGHCLYNAEPYRHARLADFPPSFSLLSGYRWLGGEKIQELVRQAGQDPRREVSGRIIEVGQFRSVVVQIRAKTP